jgi:hypothetical protein
MLRSIAHAGVSLIVPEAKFGRLPPRDSTFVKAWPPMAWQTRAKSLRIES